MRVVVARAEGVAVDRRIERGATAAGGEQLERVEQGRLVGRIGLRIARQDGGQQRVVGHLDDVGVAEEGVEVLREGQG